MMKNSTYYRIFLGRLCKLHKKMSTKKVTKQPSSPALSRSVDPLRNLDYSRPYAKRSICRKL